MLKKLSLAFGLIGVLIFVWVGLNRLVEDEVVRSKSVTFSGGDVPIRAVATFYPLQALAQEVVGELGIVSSIVPGGVEPHDFEPTPKDIKDLYSANLVIINGAGMDPWAEKLVPDLLRKGVTVKVLANEVELLQAEEHGHADEGEEEEHDPHFWLDPVIVSELAKSIGTALVERFPEEKATLENQVAATITLLQALDTEYRTGLAACKLDEVVASHNAFAYLAKRYDFSVHALSGISPEEELSPRELAEVAEEVRESGIRYIFFETLVSSKLAETLAQEVGAETLVFNPIEGITDEEADRGEDYFSLMRSNLKALQKALECE